MRTISLVVATASLMLGLTTSGFADKVRELKFAHDPVAEGMSRLAGPPKAPDSGKLRPGVPGFYDPATRTFQPLALHPRASSEAYTGQVVATVHLTTGSYIDPSATVSCYLFVVFGNVVGTPPQFFVDHYVQSNTRFPASQKSVDLSVYYSDVPNGAGVAKMRSAVYCETSSHYVSAFRPAHRPLNGRLPLSFDLSL